MRIPVSEAPDIEPASARGEMVIPLAPEPSDASGEARPSPRRGRARRLLSDAYERWVEQEHSERRLLDLDSVIEILTELDTAMISVQASRFLDESAARNLGSHSEHIGTILDFVRRTEVLDPPEVRFARLLRHPSEPVRRSAVRLVRELDRQVAGRVLAEHVVTERAPDILRAAIACLREAGVAPSPKKAEEILSGRPDWMTAAWALTAASGAPAALLLGDGSDFARDLGRSLASGGFRLVHEPDRSPFLHERLDPAVLEIFPLIVVVRGENYFSGNYERDHDALTQYVQRGGLLFATPWVAWENARQPFAALLPFHALRHSHHEGITLRASHTPAPPAPELFTEEFTFEISYEELSSHPDTTVLLHGNNQIPLYGFRRVGRGECHYLNVCQHHCTRSMRSPLETAAFARAMERVWRWLHARCAARTPTGGIRTG